MKFPPDTMEIQRETALLSPGMAGLETASLSTAEGCAMEARQVIIQHVDTVNIYATGGGS